MHNGGCKLTAACKRAAESNGLIPAHVRRGPTTRATVYNGAAPWRKHGTWRAETPAPDLRERKPAPVRYDGPGYIRRRKATP